MGGGGGGGSGEYSGIIVTECAPNGLFGFGEQFSDGSVGVQRIWQRLF